MPKHRLRLGIALAVLSGTAAACAVRGFPPQSGPLEPFVDAYSRNDLVCVPTFIGNVVGFSFTAPAALALVIPLAPFSGELAGEGAMLISLSGAYLVGGIFGTPFVPPSLLLPEEPCLTNPPPRE
jgi:hypothetical protein